MEKNHSSMRDAQEFPEYYDEVLTSGFQAKLKEKMKEELFWNYTGAALGDGIVWLTVSDGVIIKSS